MNRRTWSSGLAVGALLTLLAGLNQMLAPDRSLELSATTHGKSLHGFGVVYDLMSELGQEPERSRVVYSQVPRNRPLWLLSPGGGRLGPSAPNPWLRQLRPWVEAGGTAVVFGGPGAQWWSWGLPALPTTRTVEPGAAAGNLRTSRLGPQSHSSAPRHAALEPLESLELFALEAGPLRAQAMGEIEGMQGQAGERLALAVALPLGAGQVVAVSDARLFNNERLAVAEHALLAADLSAAYGAPRFDERCHGLTPVRSVLGALGVGRLLLIVLGVGATALLWLWSRARVPSRRLRPPPPFNSSLAAFVDSLAHLYHRSAARNAAEVYRAYQEGFLLLRPRARPRLGEPRQALGQEESEQALAPAPELAPPATPTALLAAVRALEREAARTSVASPARDVQS